jgi:hypothetical protein
MSEQRPPTWSEWLRNLRLRQKRFANLFGACPKDADTILPILSVATADHDGPIANFISL